ncbi:hypothetical protein KC909_04985 [Candidatus Dojkabacteria bacterium]|uniref:Uncharacterized protein n=1 Tax=Candidatus Dojkabacteria bacterium TaxID=2099670 RepID=A0A955RJE0_9BACT|nr:hypothetical protein [Candidatus Dojkabacteria bacterium]
MEVETQSQSNSLKQFSYKRIAAVAVALFVVLCLVVTVIILSRDNEVESNNPNQQNAVVQPTQGLEQPQPTSLVPIVEESDYYEYSGEGISFMYPTGWNVETVVSEISLKDDCANRESELTYSGLNVLYITSPDTKNKLELRLTSSCFTGGSRRIYYNLLGGEVYAQKEDGSDEIFGNYPNAYQFNLESIERTIFIHDRVVKYYIETINDEYFTDDVVNYIELDVFPVEYGVPYGVTNSFDVECDITQPELCEEFVTTFFETVKKI